MSECLRCKDLRHKPKWMKNPWEEKFWCRYARELLSTDPQFKNYLYDGRSENWAKICDKSGKNATWNKKCDVEEVVSEMIKNAD